MKCYQKQGIEDAKVSNMTAYIQYKKPEKPGAVKAGMMTLTAAF